MLAIMLIIKIERLSSLKFFKIPVIPTLPELLNRRSHKNKEKNALKVRETIATQSTRIGSTDRRSLANPGPESKKRKGAQSV